MEFQDLSTTSGKIKYYFSRYGKWIAPVVVFGVILIIFVAAAPSTDHAMYPFTNSNLLSASNSLSAKGNGALEAKQSKDQASLQSTQQASLEAKGQATLQAQKGQPQQANLAQLQATTTGMFHYAGNGTSFYNGLDAPWIDLPTLKDLGLFNVLVDASDLSSTLAQAQSLEKVDIRATIIYGQFSRVYLPNLKEFKISIIAGIASDYQDASTIKNLLFFDLVQGQTWDLNTQLLSLNMNISVAVDGMKLITVNPTLGTAYLNVPFCNDLLKNIPANYQKILVSSCTLDPTIVPPPGVKVVSILKTLTKTPEKLQAKPQQAPIMLAGQKSQLMEASSLQLQASGQPVLKAVKAPADGKPKAGTGVYFFGGNGTAVFDGLDAPWVNKTAMTQLNLFNVILDGPTFSNSLAGATNIEKLNINAEYIQGEFNRVYLPKLTDFTLRLNTTDTAQVQDPTVLKSLLFFDKVEGQSWDLSQLLMLNMNITVSAGTVKIIDINDSKGTATLNVPFCNEIIDNAKGTFKDIVVSGCALEDVSNTADVKYYIVPENAASPGNLQAKAYGLQGSLQAQNLQQGSLQGSLQANKIQQGPLQGSLQAQNMQQGSLQGSLQAQNMQQGSLQGSLQAQNLQQGSLQGSLQANKIQQGSLQGSLQAQNLQQGPLQGSLQAQSLQQGSLQGSLQANKIQQRPLQGSLQAQNMQQGSLQGSLQAQNMQQGSLQGSLQAQNLQQGSLQGSLQANKIQQGSLQGSLQAQNLQQGPLQGSLQAQSLQQGSLQGSLQANKIQQGPLQGSLQAQNLQQGSLQGSLQANKIQQGSLQGSLQAQNLQQGPLQGSLQAQSLQQGPLQGSLQAQSLQQGSLQGSLQANKIQQGSLQGSLQAQNLQQGPLQGSLQAQNLHQGPLQGSLQAQSLQQGSLQGSLQANKIQQGPLQGSLQAQNLQGSVQKSSLQSASLQGSKPTLQKAKASTTSGEEPLSAAKMVGRYYYYGDGLSYFTGFDSVYLNKSTIVNLELNNVIIDAPNFSTGLEGATNTETINIQPVYIHGMFGRVYLPKLKSFKLSLSGADITNYKDADFLQNILFFDKTTKPWDIRTQLLDLGVNISITVDDEKIIEVDEGNGVLTLNVPFCAPLLQNLRSTFTKIVVGSCAIEDVTLPSTVKYLNLELSHPTTKANLQSVLATSNALEEFHGYVPAKSVNDQPILDLNKLPALKKLSLIRIGVAGNTTTGVSDLTLEASNVTGVIDNLETVFMNVQAVSLFNVRSTPDGLQNKLVKKILDMKPAMLMLSGIKRKSDSSADANTIEQTLSVLKVAPSAENIMMTSVNGSQSGWAIPDSYLDWKRYDYSAFKDWESYTRYRLYDSSASPIPISVQTLIAAIALAFLIH